MKPGRLFALTLWFLIAQVSAVFGQQTVAQLTVEPMEAEAVVGQPIVLRLTLLVPTFMPDPPTFPTFDMPGLVVRIPERASTPTSKTVNGETWAGMISPT